MWFASSSSLPSDETIALLAREVPFTEIARADLEAGISLVDLMIRIKLADSKGAARKLIEGGGMYLNNERQIRSQKIITIDDLKWPTAFMLRTGKKNYHLVVIK